MKQVAAPVDRVPGPRARSRAALSPNGSGSSPRDLRLVRAFYRISLLGSGPGSPEEIAARVLRELALALRFRRAEIVLLERRRLRRLAAYGRVRIAPAAGGGERLRDCPFGRSLMRRRQAILHAGHGRQRGRGPGRRLCHVRWYGVTSLFGVPLRGPDRPIGFILADRGGRPFDLSATDLEVATALAGLITEVVSGALTRSAEARRQAGFRLLSQVGRAISAVESLPILLPRLAREARAVTRALGVVIALYDEKAGQMEVAGIAGPPGQYSRGYRFSARPHVTALSPRVLRTGRAVAIRDLRKAPQVCAYWPSARAVLVVPIRSRGKILGTLRIEETVARAFDDDEIRLYGTLADQIGHAIRKGRVLEALGRRHADLHAVSESLERRIEEDRRRIARELHDELGQSMTAAKINLGLLRDLTRGGDPEVRRVIRETEGVVLRTIAETRRIAMDLRPSMLDELGLVPALRWYSDTFSRRTGIGVQLLANGNGGPADKDLNTLLFRFFQEALTNVARHARARRVRLGLKGHNGSIRALVSDDGVGLGQAGSAHQGLGLIGMRERIERAGGALRIQSRPGRGTRLMVQIPMAEADGVIGRAGRPGGGRLLEGGAR